MIEDKSTVIRTKLLSLREKSVKPKAESLERSLKLINLYHISQREKNKRTSTHEE